MVARTYERRLQYSRQGIWLCLLVKQSCDSHLVWAGDPQCYCYGCKDQGCENRACSPPEGGAGVPGRALPSQRGHVCVKLQLQTSVTLLPCCTNTAQDGHARPLSAKHAVLAT